MWCRGIFGRFRLVSIALKTSDGSSNLLCHKDLSYAKQEHTEHNTALPPLPSQVPVKHAYICVYIHAYILKYISTQRERNNMPYWQPPVKTRKLN